MTKKIVITGGCGYIGSHIAKALTISGGYEITVVDWVMRSHTLPYINQYVNADYDSDETYQLLKKINPDVIIHCANYLNVGESVVDPAIYYNNNVAKTARFLEQIKNLPNVPYVIFNSSAAVYGNPATVPIKENSTLAPINPYGHTKLMIEQMLTDFDTAYGLKSVCLRFFNACGADPYDGKLGQAEGAGHIIAKLLESIVYQQTFTLNGTDFNTKDGTCIRDYVHVWDIATAHVNAIDYLFKNNQSLTLNLGSSLGYSNQDVINTVKDIVGPVDVTYGSRRAGDPDCLIADSLDAKNILGWIPQYSTLPVIVDTAWKWYLIRETI